MKPSSHPLRFLAVAFFIFMIAGPVLYRCGVFKKQEQMMVRDFNPLAEAMTQPWFDSTAFRKMMAPDDSPKMYSSKSGPAFGSLPPDTLTALELMEMRYTVPRMSAADAAAFAAAEKRLNDGALRFFSLSLEPATQDSIALFFYVKAGASALSRLPEPELKIVQSALKQLTDNKLSEGKTPYLGLIDTLMALKSLRIENLILPVK